MINGRRLTDTATKTGIEAAQTASKGVVQKTVGATGDLTGNKIADQITSVGKSRNKEKKKDEVEETYIPPEKRQKIINDCFKHSIKMEYEKVTNLLGSTSDKEDKEIIQRFMMILQQAQHLK